MTREELKKQRNKIRGVLDAIRVIRRRHASRPADQPFIAFHPVYKRRGETTLVQLEEYESELKEELDRIKSILESNSTEKV